MFFSDCHYPPAFTAIHAEDIKICDKTCEVFFNDSDQRTQREGITTLRIYQYWLFHHACSD